MALPATRPGKTIDFIIDIINQYNSSKQQHESINFVHSNSSLALALMGKTAIVTRPKASQIIMIPYAILPLGKFRKQFGVFPQFLDPNMESLPKGSRRGTYYLHGCTIDALGIDRCYQSLASTKYLTKTIELHKLILETITEIKPSNYIRSLKKLVMLMTNMMIVDKEGGKYTEYYLSLLNNERRMLQQQGINPKFFFDKYFLRLEHILHSKIGPIHADDQLRLEIIHQYPILICSVCNALPHDEDLDVTELTLDSIKIFFTPEPFVAHLKQRLEEIGHTQEILVYGVTEDGVVETYDEPTEAFFNAHVIPDLASVSEVNPSILQNKKVIHYKFMNSFFNYLDGQELENLHIAVWLLKNADPSVIVEICQAISRRLDFVLEESLHVKAGHNQTYLDLVANILTADYLSRLKDIAYLKALLRLRQNVPDYQMLLKYEEHLSFQQLNAILEPEKTRNENVYLGTYLQRLQDFYQVLSRDVAFQQKHLEHISKRLAFVQNKFMDLIEECEKKGLLGNETKQSDLYDVIQKMQPETTQHWYVLLFKGLAKSKRGTKV